MSSNKVAKGKKRASSPSSSDVSAASLAASRVVAAAKPKSTVEEALDAIAAFREREDYDGPLVGSATTKDGVWRKKVEAIRAMGETPIHLVDNDGKHHVRSLEALQYYQSELARGVTGKKLMQTKGVSKPFPKKVWLNPANAEIRKQLS